jgi:hypothetical protein
MILETGDIIAIIIALSGSLFMLTLFFRQNYLLRRENLELKAALTEKQLFH